ncbi:hypothetical protein C8Q77DRAFT_94171 [Trametes polyzona]|nr:hypothetical protein C8Q77DRAFT_94171 [Trametes polyzona]
MRLGHPWVAADGAHHSLRPTCRCPALHAATVDRHSASMNQTAYDRPQDSSPASPRHGTRERTSSRQSRSGHPLQHYAPRIWRPRDEAQNSRMLQPRRNDGRGTRNERSSTSPTLCAR